MYTSEGYKSRQDFVESRSKADRRNKGSLSIRSLLIGGRRETIRRHEDQQRLLYVDQYSQSHFIAIVLILFLSVIDAILTIVLTNNGATEINPIMAYYLDVGPFTFLSVKYSLTSVGLIVLLIFRNIILKPTRIYAGYLFYYLLVIFIGVISWQLFLTYRLIG